MSDTASHGQLMDDIYRFQRLIYDVTRKYYLLGRDDLIAGMNPRPGDSVLEIACGTGRNLDKVRRVHPDIDLYGLDISEQMLVSARKKLGGNAALVQGDACDFDPQALFGRHKFDHIVLSYSLSMIPDWQAALREAMRHLKTGGTLHIVDFGDQARLPDWFKSILRAWLRRFHVAPRDDLINFVENTFAETAKINHRTLYRGYTVALTLQA